MTRLSVNVNKVALLRNARNINIPHLVQFAQDCEKFGAEGITVHPRPDERHIRYSDIPELKGAVTTELNVEGYPSEDFMQLVITHAPAQVTLVPDAPEQLTSDHGWDTLKQQDFLVPIIQRLQSHGMRVSLFVDPNIEMVKGAKNLGAECVELFTEPYASQYAQNAEEAIAPYKRAYQAAQQLNLHVNAGHDLNLENLGYLHKQMPDLQEVSIGHALVADALYYGIQNTIGLYKRLLI